MAVIDWRLALRLLGDVVTSAVQPPKQNIRRELPPLEEAIRYCQSLGMRLSRQRRYVLELIYSVNTPLSARAIYDELNQRGKKIGHTSVYQNLEALVEQSVIDCIDDTDEQRLYHRHMGRFSRVNSNQVEEYGSNLHDAVLQKSDVAISSAGTEFLNFAISGVISRKTVPELKEIAEFLRAKTGDDSIDVAFFTNQDAIDFNQELEAEAKKSDALLQQQKLEGARLDSELELALEQMETNIEELCGKNL
ncbi:transcriptional repressor [Leptothoe sp. EHU-05/26/07-4]